MVLGGTIQIFTGIACWWCAIFLFSVVYLKQTKAFFIKWCLTTGIYVILTATSIIGDQFVSHALYIDKSCCIRQGAVQLTSYNVVQSCTLVHSML